MTHAYTRHWRERVLLFVAWTLLVASAVVLATRYGALPESIPLYRVPWNDGPLVGPRTPATVGRIVAMGIGQAGAASVMARCAWRHDGWRRFWAWATLTAGAKTILECLGFASSADRAFGALTGVVVVAFLVAAATWWWRGALAGAVTVDPVSRIGLVASLGLWAVAAALGRFV